MKVIAGSFKETKAKRRENFQRARDFLAHAEEESLPFVLVVPQETTHNREPDGVIAAQGSMLAVFSTANREAGVLGLMVGAHTMLNYFENKYIDDETDGSDGKDEKTYH